MGVFVSSYGLGFRQIAETVRALAESGIQEIELTGGSEWYSEWKSDLLSLKKKHGLQFRCHNYFPPPKSPFVLNLASLNDEVWKMSVNHCREAIDLSQEFGAKEYGVHAGFLIDIRLNELGRAIENRDLFNRKQAIDRFCKTVAELNEYALGRGIQLYIENNVINKKTLDRFQGLNPLLLCDFDAFLEMKKVVNFSLLLDVAHLKVSCHSLGLNFADELKKLAAQSDYLHLSDNDGLTDSNQTIYYESDLANAMKDISLKSKKLTIEIYSGIDGIQESLESVKKLCQ